MTTEINMPARTDEKLTGRKWTPKELANLTDAELVTKITDAHGRFIAGLKMSLEAAYEAGQFLTWKKEQLPHGQWMPWVKKNLPDLSHRSVTGYMDVASNWKTIAKKAKRVGRLNLRQALDECTDDRVTKGKSKRKVAAKEPGGETDHNAVQTKTDDTVKTGEPNNVVAPISGLRLFSGTSGVHLSLIHI